MTYPNVLQGKFAIVIGGSHGVGREICRDLARQGARVAIVDLDASAVTALADELDPSGVRIIAISCNETSDAEIARAVRESVDWFGSIDILVNSTLGIGTDLALGQLGDDVAAECRVVAGPTATVRFMKACHPHMMLGGHVINVGRDSVMAALPHSVLREWEWTGIAVRTLVHALAEDEAAALARTARALVA
jgi:NAD(P)-dependent dehydrogenase (short-subunit alcohol dehydrogenase family)